jgi:hypothetical protein
MNLRKPKLRVALVASCTLTLAGLGLMVWSLVDPRPIPIMVAMSAGQTLGIVSLLLFGWVVISDLRRGGSIIPPEEPPKSLTSLIPPGPPSSSSLLPPAPPSSP